MNIKKIFTDLGHTFPFMGEARVTAIDASTDVSAGLYADETGISLMMDESIYNRIKEKEIVISGIRGDGNMNCFTLGIKLILSGEKSLYGYMVDRGMITMNSINIMPPIRKSMVLDGSEYRSAAFTVDRSRCTGCQRCVSACPAKAIKSAMETEMPRVGPEFFAARKMGEPERRHRSAEDMPPAGRPVMPPSPDMPGNADPMAARMRAMMMRDSMGDPGMPGSFNEAPEGERKLGKPVIIIESQCMRCGECVRACPAGAIITN